MSKLTWSDLQSICHKYIESGFLDGDTVVCKNEIQFSYNNLVFSMFPDGDVFICAEGDSCESTIRVKNRSIEQMIYLVYGFVFNYEGKKNGKI